jgi:hypothetical protein
MDKTRSMSLFNIKRVNSELRIIQNKINSDKMPMFLKEYKFEIVENFLEITGPDFFSRLEIPKNYPFRPYKVNFSKIPHLRNLINVQEKIKNNDKHVYIFFFKSLYSIEPTFLKTDTCYCCSSVTCSNIWCPSFSFVKVLFEQLEIEFIESYSSVKSFNYLKNIYGRLFEKIPIEVIDKIVNMNLVNNTGLQD